VPDADRLRSLLLTPEEAANMDAHGSVDAGVLVPLFRGPRGELNAVFTRRRDDLRRHAGEISFPGGRQDFPGEELLATALRESYEEIGLEPDAVEVVGALPPTATFVTGYRIHPFVGLIEPGQRWRVQEAEVDAVLELALPALQRGFELKRLVRRGVPFKTPTYTADGNFVWGATARILGHLLDRLEPILRETREP
jgi:8-oxo-dGTP pyrophosphatase MutT (NUDIX family)